MDEVTFDQLPAASTIDGAADHFAINTASLNATQKINRNTFLGVSGQPVDTTTNQTVAGKTFNNTNIATLRDDRFTLQDDGDNTKQLRLQLSGITTGQTRILTAPDRSSTIATLGGDQAFTGANSFTGSSWVGGSIDNATVTVDSISGHTNPSIVTVGGLQINNGVLSTNNSVVTNSLAPGAVTAAKLSSDLYVWELLGRATLAVAGDALTVSGLQPRRYLRIYITIITSGQTVIQMNFNNDNSNNYARQSVINYTAPADAVSVSTLQIDGGAATEDKFAIIEILNMATKEKFGVCTLTESGGTGAGTAPDSSIQHLKWANTAQQINRIDLTNASTGDYAVGSEIIVMGHD